ncbi:MAG: hypothetical protein ACLQVD_10965 [Capsulimonadaceae bacterium]
MITQANDLDLQPGESILWQAAPDVKQLLVRKYLKFILIAAIMGGWFVYSDMTVFRGGETIRPPWFQIMGVFMPLFVLAFALDAVRNTTYVVTNRRLARTVRVDTRPVIEVRPIEIASAATAAGFNIAPGASATIVFPDGWKWECVPNARQVVEVLHTAAAAPYAGEVLPMPAGQLPIAPKSTLLLTMAGSFLALLMLSMLAAGYLDQRNAADLAALYARSPGCGGSTIDASLPPCQDYPAVIDHKDTYETGGRSSTTMYEVALRDNHGRITSVTIPSAVYSVVDAGQRVTGRLWRNHIREILAGSQTYGTNWDPARRAEVSHRMFLFDAVFVPLAFLFFRGLIVSRRQREKRLQLAIDEIIRKDAEQKARENTSERA